MDLPKLKEIDFDGKNVIVRGDLDTNLQFTINNLQIKDTRLQALVKTVKHIQEKGAKRIFVIGHKGRPDGEFKEEETLFPLLEILKSELNQDVFWVSKEMFSNLSSDAINASECRIFLLDNLRFWKAEESENNDERNDFANKIIEKFDVNIYVNEAFASSHRNHTSIVDLPKLIKNNCSQPSTHCLSVGLRFEEEIENLRKLLDGPKRPFVSILSGVKRDKLDYVKPLEEISDLVLLAGRLAEYLGDERVSVRLREKGQKTVCADLTQDHEDITIYSMEVFENEIEEAQTVLFAGPVGKYEEEGHRQGTSRVLEAIRTSNAVFKVAGGGDSEKAIDKLGYTDAFDWISVGGGAMLDYLANKTLPGIEAVK